MSISSKRTHIWNTVIEPFVLLFGWLITIFLICTLVEPRRALLFVLIVSFLYQLMDIAWASLIKFLGEEYPEWVCIFLLQGSWPGIDTISWLLLGGRIHCLNWKQMLQMGKIYMVIFWKWEFNISLLKVWSKNYSGGTYWKFNHENKRPPEGLEDKCGLETKLMLGAVTSQLQKQSAKIK